jgi:hypothetical protein
VAKLLPSKGVFVRPRWDWRLEQAACGGTHVAGVGGQVPFIALLNDIAPPALIGVYIMIGSTGVAGNTVSYAWVNGSIGAKVSAGQSVIVNGPQIGGSIWSGNQVAAPGTQLITMNNGANGFLAYATSPIFLVPPNYSLICYSPTAGSALDASFFWAYE